MALKRQELTTAGSDNGSMPSSNGRSAEEFEVAESSERPVSYPAEERGSGSETPEPWAKSLTDTQQFPLPEADEPRVQTIFPPDEQSPEAAPDYSDPLPRRSKPRSAAAEEFLMETPEFSLTRNREDGKQSRAQAKADRKAKSQGGGAEPMPKARGRKARKRERREAGESEHQTLGEWFREVTLLGLIAVSSALFLTTYVVQAFFIPSESMEDTLRVNDRVLVNKLAYRFGEPVPGDVVVFAAQSDQIAEEEPDTVFARGFNTVATALGLKSSAQDLIKRVVAVEGQTVEIEVGLLYVDGEEVQDESYRKDFEAMQDYGPTTVPEEHVFVMGDNRRNSSDSRVFGPIPESSLVGEAFARIWPLDRFEWLGE